MNRLAKHSQHARVAQPKKDLDRSSSATVVKRGTATVTGYEEVVQLLEDFSTLTREVGLLLPASSFGPWVLVVEHGVSSVECRGEVWSTRGGVCQVEC